MYRPRKTSRSASPRDSTFTDPAPGKYAMIRPESGVRIPAIRCSSVVLPDPLVPTSATCSPSLSVSDSTSITGTGVPSGSTYRFFSCCSSRGICRFLNHYYRRLGHRCQRKPSHRRLSSPLYDACGNPREQHGGESEPADALAQRPLHLQREEPPPAHEQ